MASNEINRIIVSMVTKNEEDRYLGAVLSHCHHFTDDIFVYDDASGDGTAALAKELGAVVEVRPDGYPSFQEHEGKFRHDAYLALQYHFNLRPGDWILALDADEFLIADERLWGVRDRLEEAAEHAKTVEFDVVEIFDVDIQGIPLVRVDGFWGQIRQLRFYAWQPMGVFPDRTLACGSLPTYARDRTSWNPIEPVILHYGYARMEDRVSKYARYFGAPGHSVGHVDSILRPAKLKVWDGPLPRFQ